MVGETCEFSPSGNTFYFHVRYGFTFHSGNALTAHDAAYSLQRAVNLDLSPAFILTQFGLTKENVDQMVTAPDDRTLIFRTDQAYAPTFLLFCLTARVGAVVDSKLLHEPAAAGDIGHPVLQRNPRGHDPSP